MKKKYLDFGIIENKKKRILRSINGLDGYNLFHLSVRFKEKAQLIKLLNKNKINSHEIPRWQKFFLLTIFFYFSNCNKILELGSSSCEFIEGLKIFEKFLSLKIIKKNTKFYGIEIYDCFNILSEQIHKNDQNKLTCYNNVDLFLKKNKNYSDFFFHDYGVSMYAFDSTKKYIDFINKFNSAFIKLAFLKNKSKFMYLSGTKTFYFNFAEFIKKCNKPIYKLFHDPEGVWSSVDNNKDIIHGYFYIGNNIKKILNNNSINSLFNKKNFYIKKLN